MDIEILNKAFEEDSNKFFEIVDKQDISEDFIREVNEVYENQLMVYLEGYDPKKLNLDNLVDISKDFRETLNRPQREFVEKYSTSIDSEFFELLATMRVSLLLMNFFDEHTATNEIDSDAVMEMKMAYHEKYREVLRSSNVDESLADEISDEFRKYLAEEMEEVQLDLYSENVNSEENRAFVEEKVAHYQFTARKKYGKQIDEELLDVLTLQLAYLILETSHAKANPSGVQLNFSADSTREEVEGAFVEMMQKHPKVFENKKLEDLVDEAMAQIESGEQYNETAKLLMQLEEREQALKDNIAELKEQNRDEPTSSFIAVEPEVQDSSTVLWSIVAVLLVVGTMVLMNI